jgi:hypothetical protein
MAAISLAIREDLRTQHDSWVALRAMAKGSGSPQVTHVRLLDIIAWHAGQNPNQFSAASGP